MAAPAGLRADGVEALIVEISARFAAHPTIRRAVLSVLEPLSSGWANHPQGMTVDGFREIEAALLSPLEALRTVDPAHAMMAADQLSTAWERVRGKVDWIG